MHKLVTEFHKVLCLDQFYLPSVCFLEDVLLGIASVTFIVMQMISYYIYGSSQMKLIS